MAIVGFESMKDFQYVAKAAHAVNRGALEHPFHRRRGPVGGSDPVLLCSAETGQVLLPGDTGKCVVVDPVTLDVDDNGGDEYDIDMANCAGMLFPGKVSSTYSKTSIECLCWGVPGEEGTYFAITGGTQSFSGTYNGSTVDPNSPRTADAVTCTVFCSETLVADQNVFAVLRGDTPVIIASCCPPDPE